MEWGLSIAVCYGEMISPERSGRLLAPRLFFLRLVVDGDLLQIFRFEDLIAVHTADVVHSVTAHEEFRARMFTARHRNRISLF